MHNLPQGTAINSISLLLGHPDPTTLLTPALGEAVERALESPLLALQYGREQGNPLLIEYLAGKIRRDQALPLSEDQIMITAGSTHAVDMIARLCGRPGGVIVEAPTYADALHIFRDHGLDLYAVPMDAEGVRADLFESVLQRPNPPRLFYTIPNFHNPTGITLSERRRRQIVAVARRCGVTIVEDDVYRDLAFDAPVPPSFLSLDETAIQIGSFSKTLAPGLRLGWAAASAATIQRFVGCGVTQMGGGASPLSAQIAAEYCRHGDWETHVDDLRRRYRARHDTMLAALDRWMPAGVTWTKPGGGFFVWVTLPEGAQAREVKQRALARGVMVAAGENYFVAPADGARHLRLTYSFAPPDQIETAVRLLAEAIENS